MMPFLPRKKSYLAILVAFSLSACSAIQPRPLEEKDLLEQGRADLATAQRDVQPITGELTLDEAQARALKYNMDRRAKMMDEALAFRQLDVSHFDMLPRLLAQAGYSNRNNDKITLSRNPDGSINNNRVTTQEREHNTYSLGLSWSLLDLGVGYYNTRQQAERVQIAGEKRRKAMHLLMQDVRSAFWRAYSAQKLRGEVQKTTRLAEQALADSRTAENERLRNPIDALRYQRQILENLRLLEAIDAELASARIELAALINVPLTQAVTLAQPSEAVGKTPLDIPVELMEETAIRQNPDIRENHHNARIAREETRKTLVKLFPNLTFNYGYYYDTDRFQVNNDWREASVQLSFNLFNLFTGPSQMKLAEAGVALADQRRVATQMAVLAQVHLARQQYANALQQFERADAIWQTDSKISEHIKNREQAQAQSKLDVVANQTTAILSLLRRYQAMSQLQGAEARLQATLGVEQSIPSVSEISLNDLTHDIGRGRDVWISLKVPAQAPSTGAAQ
ncbi:MAG: TolC family protein [Zoogloea sp.]|uniref:TolC family protein n=1 Tax=Zoogloea sp. TaxID=49181 RepID=UPI00262BCD45|nr:TolC family protein [Zoogloea sp.]MDD3329238.1 TolC family protein [Zoogloea sp.]